MTSLDWQSGVTAVDGPRVVALGGGHGLFATLSALRRVSGELSAVVTVADDGGSSGRLRTEFGVLPPGDLRMALAALCGDDEWGHVWSEVIQHRFHSEGELDGHAVGNLLIAALWQLLDDSVAGLDWVGRLLGAHGRVLPMASIPLDIVAEVEGADPARPHEVTTIRGQVACASTRGRVRSISLVPPEPPASPHALKAVREAEWVVLGPGSWFTSVLPHLQVPELAQAIARTSARRVVVLNLSPQRGETDGFAGHDYLEVLGAHAPELGLDAVLCDTRGVADREDRRQLEEAAAKFGASLVVSDLAAGDGAARHDPWRLASTFDTLFRGA